MINIVFMGAPDFAVPSLRRLMAGQRVAGVVTQPDRPAGRGRQLQPPPIKRVAQEAGIPVYQPPSLRSEAAIAPLREWRPDLIVVVAFGQILRPLVLNLPPRGCLNVHASLLPRWRGAAPIQHAILAGDTETGVTLMQMDEGMDTGPIYVSQAVPIQADDNAASLHDRLAQVGADLLAAHLDDIVNGRIAPTPQDETQATYAPMIKKEDGRLDWNKPAVQLERQVRAMTPWPGAFTSWQGRHLKLLKTRLVDQLPAAQKPPGSVIAHNDGALVLTADGELEILELQLAGKRPTAISHFLHGQPDFMGSVLE